MKNVFALYTLSLVLLLCHAPAATSATPPDAATDARPHTPPVAPTVIPAKAGIQDAEKGNDSGFPIKNVGNDGEEKDTDPGAPLATVENDGEEKGNDPGFPLKTAGMTEGKKPAPAKAGGNDPAPPLTTVGNDGEAKAAAADSGLPYYRPSQAMPGVPANESPESAAPAPTVMPASPTADMPAPPTVIPANAGIQDEAQGPDDSSGLPYYRPSEALSVPTLDAQPTTPAGVDAPSAPSGALSEVPAAAPTHLSSDMRVMFARTLLQRNRFAEALDILRPLVPGHPDQTDVRFLLGLAASRWSQSPEVEDEERFALLDEAIAAFRSILIRQPGLVRVRLELALAFYMKEEDALARDHFERVLVGNPPAGLVSTINQFLNLMRARRRWTAYFGFSVAPDTNINAASDAEFIYINGLPFRRDATGRSSSDIGIVGWGGGEYQYPLTNRWRLRGGIDLNQREYKGKTFDQTFVGGYLGPRWLIGRNTEASLLATASQRWFGQYSFNYDFGARLEVEHRVFPGLLASARASWQDRTYQQQTFLEGPLMVFSLGASYVLFPTVQLSALSGYLQQDAKAHSWSNVGYWTRLGADVALPWGFTVGASGELRWENYESGWFPFIPDNSAREDQTRILQATLLNRALTVYGFSPQILFSNELRESNAQLFDFRRNRVELRWVRQF